MKLKVYTKDGSGCTEQDFANIPQFEGDKGLFALKETIVAYQANMRQGNASTLNYGEVHGTSRKPFKQKGGGRSRHGTTKSVIHRHGAVVFGPRPRDWSKKINRKVKQLAFSRALFDKCSESSLSIIESFEAPSEVKTKKVAEVFSRIQPEGKILLVDDAFDANFALASRNIARLSFCESSTLTALDLVTFANVIFSRRALDTVLARINKDER